MDRKSSTHILVTYVLSLTVAVSLLVTWVVYVLHSQAKLNELAQRVGLRPERFHWAVLGIGCTLLGLLIGGLTYQLAQALSEQRYARKQNEFVSNITHELKSPLAAIRLHAETLLQGDVDDRERRRFLRYILQQQERMSALVDNVLEVSRLVSRPGGLVLEPLTLAPFLDRYLEEARERVSLQGRTLTARIATHAVVRATESALHRVLDNLVDNAVRFSADGGEIRCQVTDSASQVILAIEDDGIGIPRGEVRKVFDRFYQIGKGNPGTGLGLAIVKELVREMGGTVRVVVQENRPGSRFEIELPLFSSLPQSAEATG